MGKVRAFGKGYRRYTDYRVQNSIETGTLIEVTQSKAFYVSASFEKGDTLIIFKIDFRD